MSSLSYLPPQALLRTNPFSSQSPQVIPSFSFRQNPWLLQPHLCALKNGSRGTSIGNQESYLLRKPVVSQADDVGGILGEDRYVERNRGYKLDGEENERWVDWEDQIFEDTVPLVGFVRMILHPARYESGDRLNPEHEKTILEKLLPFHPEFEKKVGCGIDYITVGYHPDFESSRCLFIVRKDGELVDFSYWKCIKGLIRKNYPSYADSFILRHFRRRRRHY